MMENYIEKNKEEQLTLLRKMCQIPAPSHMEQERAEFCKKWLEDAGASGVYIDSVKNVIFPINCEGSNEITVFAAHTDTVFPDTEPMEYKEDEEKIYCPGVGDDTASVTAVMMAAKYFIEKNIKPAKGIMFVLNSCEEGLGNLVGTRQLFQDFEGRISQFITVDSNLKTVSNKCVGSHRYQVEIKTVGGHSFQSFGNPNAIAKLSEIVTEIYKLQVPVIGNSRTSYNVGIIQGGTSVNTIAQSASMLCEYRSDNKDCLEIMGREFARIFEEAKVEGVEVIVEKIGDRPCGANIDEEKMGAFEAICKNVIEDVIKQPVTFKSASTDCNIPASLGVPALCIGAYNGGGSHTREEWLEKASLVKGLEIMIRLALKLSGC